MAKTKPGELTVSDLRAFLDNSWNWFNEKWKTAEENERLKSPDHWTAEQKSAINAQGRIDYSIGLMSAKENQVITFQRNNRTEFDVKATNDPNDELKAEVAKVQIKDVEKRSDFDFVESDVFDAGLTAFVGVYELFFEKDQDFNDVLSVGEVDYKNFMWDANAFDYEKNKSLWQTKFRKIYRYQLRDEYGEEAAKDANNVFKTQWGRKQQTFYLSQGENSDYDLITLFEHYQKVIVDYHYVIFNDHLNVHGLKDKPIALKTRDKKQADALLRKLQAPYIFNNQSIEGSEVVKSSEDGIVKYDWYYDKILKEELTDYQSFPFSIYQSFHFKDQIWTMSDVLKSMQLFVDRYIGQIDYSFGKDIKNAYEVVVNNLADNYTLDEALTKMNEDGVLPVKLPGTIKNIRSQGANPQWMQMVQVMQSFMEDLSGGRSFQGLSEAADESGVAIKEKRLGGEQLAGLFLDNMTRCKRDLGNKIIERLRQDKAERLIKVAGGELSQGAIQQLTEMKSFIDSSEENKGYVWMNDATHLRDAKIELTITESPYSETARERKLAKLGFLGKMRPDLLQTDTFTEELIKAVDISFDIKSKLMAELQQVKQQNAQMQQAAMQSEQAKNKSETEKNQIEGATKISDSQVKKTDSSIKMFEAETERMNVVMDGITNAQNSQRS